MDDLPGIVVDAASAAGAGNDRTRIAPITVIGAAGGAVGGVAAAQALATAFPGGPYLAIGGPLLAGAVLALLVRRVVRARLVRGAALGLAFACVGFALLFAGAG